MTAIRNTGSAPFTPSTSQANLTNAVSSTTHLAQTPSSQGLDVDIDAYIPPEGDAPSGSTVAGGSRLAEDPALF